MNWTIMMNGKHKGLTLPQIIFKDADWFFWAYENKVFKGNVALEAANLNRKARLIKVPDRYGENVGVEYIIHNRKVFGTMNLTSYVPGQQRENVSEVMDFYVPRIYKEYDKTGYKNFVFALKCIIFGNPSKRMNKAACEEFFNDDENFDLS